MSKREQELLDRIAELEEILGLTATIPCVVALRERGLPPVGARLLGLLLKRPFVGKSTALDALYSKTPVDDRPTEYALMQALKHVRKALKPHGITVNTHYGMGFSIPQPDRQKLFALWPEIKPQNNVIRLGDLRAPREVPFQ